MTEKEIMRLAHDWTRATKTEHPEADYRVTLASALREIYNPTTGRAAWDRIPGAEQFDRLRRRAYWLKAHDAECGKDGTPRRPILDWATNLGDLEAVADEAWIEMQDYVTLADIADSLTVSTMLTWAVRRAAERIRYAEKKHIHSSLDSADRLVSRIAAGPEEALRAAETRADIYAAAADDVDRRMIGLLEDGLTQTEIAKALDLTQPAVAYRLRRLRRRFDGQD